MGSWGVGPFENDDAVDWVVDWGDADDLSPARDALLEAVLADDYLEAPQGARAIAAAEVVAVVVGVVPIERLPDQLQEWVSAHRDVAHSLDVDAAILALDRATAEQSELRELWAEADDESWRRVVDALRARLEQFGR
jgi:hypothetical protein